MTDKKNLILRDWICSFLSLSHYKMLYYYTEKTPLPPSTAYQTTTEVKVNFRIRIDTQPSTSEAHSKLNSLNCCWGNISVVYTIH